MYELTPRSQQIFKREDIPDFTFDSQWQNSVIQTLNIVCNSISIACGITVLAITAGLRIYDKKLVDRVSLRLNAAISATDVVNSIGLLIYSFENSEGASCTFSAFLIIWLSNQYIFLTTVSPSFFKLPCILREERGPLICFK
jgi:ABC-type spermidine/putrescine transport system permease subunit II